MTVLIGITTLISCEWSESEDDTFKWVRQPEVEWNYLVYMGADNNLERFAIKNIEAMQEVGMNDNFNMLVLFDRSPGYDKTNDNWTGTKLLRITKNPTSLNADVIRDYGELDMTDSENLYNFLCLINEYFPAKHTVLDMWGHGRGVYPDVVIPTDKGIIEDYTTGYGAEKTMTVYDFANAIKKYETEKNAYIDIVQFDCCLMQMLEICYHLRDLTDYVVGPETEIAGSGSDYKNIAGYLYSNKNVDPENLAIHLTDSFYEYQKNSATPFTMCTVKTSEFADFTSVFNDYCTLLTATLETSRTDIVSIRENLKQMDNGYVEYADLYEFIKKTENIGLNVTDIISAYNKLVINSKHSDKFTDMVKGISVNFPYTSELALYYFKMDTKYIVLNFYNDTLWNTFLKKYFE